MQFAVRTLAPDMSIASVLIEAKDEADARRQVEERGLFVSEIEARRAVSFAPRRGGKLSLLLLSQELLALLSAGLGVVEGLEALLEKEDRPRARAIFERLLSSLREGKRFSAALAAQPDVFPSLYVGIVRAAEGTSDLPSALARYVEYKKRMDLVRAKVLSASIYPLILLCVGGGVSVFLIAYVVPRFAEVYQGAGRNLPWLSQAMLDWGRFAARHAGALAIAVAGCATTAVVLVRRLILKGAIGRLLAGLPGVGDSFHIYELSRLYLTIGMLTEGGIAIVNAVETAAPTVSLSVRQPLVAAAAAIREGRPLSEAFHANGLATPISLRMLRVGERTGQLGRMLTQSAVFYDEEISRWIDRFTRTFEPLLMAVIGLVVGAIVILLYMPIFDLAGDLQ